MCHTTMYYNYSISCDRDLLTLPWQRKVIKHIGKDGQAIVAADAWGDRCGRLFLRLCPVSGMSRSLHLGAQNFRVPTHIIPRKREDNHELSWMLAFTSRATLPPILLFTVRTPTLWAVFLLGPAPPSDEHRKMPIYLFLMDSRLSPARRLTNGWIQSSKLRTFPL